MPIEIIESEYIAWDGKKGNLTQATCRGVKLEDIITIPTSAAISKGDIVWLKNYKSSTVITGMKLSRSGFGATGASAAADVLVKACLLGIDPITRQPFAFKYGTAGADAVITDNLFVTIENGSAATHKVSGSFKLDKDGASFVSLSNSSYCRCEKQTTTSTAQVANADVDKVWKNARDDETLAMIAEWTMSNMSGINGALTNNAAANYDPSQRKGYVNFGVGLVFTEALSVAELQALGLKVKIKSKDTMLSETSYGINYIPATVMY